MTTTMEHLVESRALTSLDHCDRCGVSARAYTRFYRGDSELIFCLHHCNEFMAGFIEQGWSMDDHRHVFEAEIAAFNSKSKDSDF